MDTIFAILKKGLVATVFIAFAFAATYVPQNWNSIEYAHAGAAGGGATEPTQWAQFMADKAYQAADLAKSAVNIAKNTITAAQSILTAGYTFLLQNKELVLDGLAWTAAKIVVQEILDALVDWIRGGFQGRPAFVEDLGGFLLETADAAVGQYLDGLGGIGSFICSPFQLDIRVALDIKYNETVRSNGEKPVSTCKLSDIKGNLEDFISGLPGSFDQTGITGGGAGTGWENWFEVVSQPSTYTPYGAQLSAEAGMRAALINAKGDEMKILDWGDGFLSGTLCETVHGAGTVEDDCFINKPGKIVQEALSFNIDSERQALITADEFNEVLAALLSQLAKKFIGGAGGLLS